jgi:hypothetical protein
MLCEGLVVPTGSPPKAKIVADRVALGDEPPTIDPPPQPARRQVPPRNSNPTVFNGDLFLF